MSVVAWKTEWGREEQEGEIENKYKETLRIICSLS